MDILGLYWERENGNQYALTLMCMLANDVFMIPMNVPYTFMYQSSPFKGSQKNWGALTKEAYVIYMSFDKMVFYLKDVCVKIRCDHAPLCKLHNNRSHEIHAVTPYIDFEYIKHRDNILAHSLSRLKTLVISKLNFSITKYNFLRNTSFCQSNKHGFIWCMGIMVYAIIIFKWFPSATLTLTYVNIQHWTKCQYPLPPTVNSLWQMPLSWHNINGNYICHSNYQIIKMSTPQTPSKVGILQSITFPIYQMKPCLLDWWKLVFFTKFYSVIVKLSFDIEKKNRMRTLHSFIKEEFGQESVLLLWQWEKMEKKMADSLLNP